VNAKWLTRACLGLCVAVLAMLGPVRPARAYIVQVPPMFPQQIPWFAYKEIPLADVGRPFNPYCEKPTPQHERFKRA
jgi:hypothetical protein